MTAIEFRNDPERVGKARQMMEGEIFQEMLSAMRSIHPVNETVPIGISPQDVHVLMGEATGWQQYENEFLKLSRRIEPNQNASPEADYRGDEEEQ